MKKTLLALLMFVGTIPVSPAFSQQVVELNECIRVKEVYVPGTYDQNGNYIPGYVKSDRFRVPCVPNAPYYNQQAAVEEYVPVPRRRRAYQANNGVYCNPTKSALGGILGGGAAAGMSRGNAYKWSVPLGAFIGGVAFGCRTY